MVERTSECGGGVRGASNGWGRYSYGGDGQLSGDGDRWGAGRFLGVALARQGKDTVADTDGGRAAAVVVGRAADFLEGRFDDGWAVDVDEGKRVAGDGYVREADDGDGRPAGDYAEEGAGNRAVT